MKLIIDIPEEIYLEKKEDYIGDTLDRAIANGTPLQAEFEKVKAEMITELYVNRATKEALINIVDNHISELKGENNA